MSYLISPGSSSTRSTRHQPSYQPDPPSREERRRNRLHKKAMSLLNKGFRRGGSTKVRYAKKIINSDILEEGRTIAYSLLMYAILDRPNEKVFRKSFTHMAALCDHEIDRIDTGEKHTETKDRAMYERVKRLLGDATSATADYANIADDLVEHAQGTEFLACAMACYYMAGLHHERPELLDKAVALIDEHGFVPEADEEKILAPYKQLAEDLRVRLTRAAKKEAARTAKAEKKAAAKVVPPSPKPPQKTPDLSALPTLPKLTPGLLTEPPPPPKKKTEPARWRLIAAVLGLCVLISGAYLWYKATENARMARALFAQASHQFMTDQLVVAADSYRKATALDGKYVEAYIGLGNAQLALGEPAMARQYYDKALQLNPQATLALFSRGNLLWLTGDLNGAASDLYKAVELNPGSRFFHDTLARILLEKGDREGTEAMYRRAVDMNPEREWPLWGWLGMIAGDAKRDKKLLSMTAALSKERPRSPSIAYYQGIIQYRRQAWRKTIEHFETSIRLAPDAVPLEAYQFITSAYFEIGDRAACLRYAKQYEARIGFPLRAGVCSKK